MSVTLILNQPFVTTGLQTYTYTVPTGVAAATPYSVQVQAFFPGFAPQNALANQTAGVGNNTQVEQTFGAGSGVGFGAGTGGGGTGFVQGDGGTGKGGVGQGFGTGNSYQQPPSAGSNADANTFTTSGISIVVNKNSVPQFTSITPGLVQKSIQFRTSLFLTAADTVTVVVTGNATSDAQLSGVTVTAAIQQGL